MSPETRAEGDVRSESPRTADGDTAAETLIWRIADVILDSVDDAVACSHLGEHVRRLFIDANSRHLIARRIYEAFPRLALSDDDLAALERVRACEPDPNSADMVLAPPGIFVTAQGLLDYLLTGEAS